MRGSFQYYRGHQRQEGILSILQGLFYFCDFSRLFWSPIFVHIESMTPHAQTFLLGSSLKFIYFCSDGVGQFANIGTVYTIQYCMFLTDIPMPGPLVRRLCMRCHWYRIRRASVLFFIFSYQSRFAYDFHFSKLLENLIFHKVSIIPHASCIRCHWHRMHFIFFCIAKSFRLWFSLSLTPHARCSRCQLHRMHGKFQIS
jgi:hypothetical protein